MEKAVPTLFQSTTTKKKLKNLSETTESRIEIPNGRWYADNCGDEDRASDGAQPQEDGEGSRRQKHSQGGC